MALAAFALAGCSSDNSVTGGNGGGGTTGGGGGGSSTPPPDKGCTPDYPKREAVATDLESERPYLDEIPFCVGKALDGQNAYSVTNNTNAVWAFDEPSQAVPIGVGTPESSAFRETVQTGSLFPSTYMAPGETFAVALDSQWHVQTDLSYSWLGQQTFESVLKKAATKATTSILGAGSKGRAAAVGCGLSFATLVTEQKLDSGSTEKALLGIFDGASTAASCTNAIKLAAPELGTAEPALFDAVENAARAAEGANEFHSGFTLVHDFCQVYTRC